MILTLQDNIRKQAVLARNWMVYKQHSYWAANATSDFPLDWNADFVISIASYPGRIHLVPAVFESLARQSILPKHAFLVLSENDFPQRKIPDYISKLEERGVSIIWTCKNTYAVKKLIPILELSLGLGIITYDDDMIYEPHCSSVVLKHRSKNENLVIGQIGSMIYRTGDRLSLFQRNGRADVDSASSVIYLQGCGTYYDAEALDERVKDFDAISSIVPGRGSDIWFWGATKAAGTRQICARSKKQDRVWIPIPSSRKTIPLDRPGELVLEERFQNTIDFFGIREKLMLELPDFNPVSKGKF